jgi:protein-disulfide isomerase
MKFLVLLLAALSATACQTDTKGINARLDQIDHKLDVLLKNGGGNGRAGAQRVAPGRPDPSKTYSAPVAGDPFEGPADAKVTIVKAYDYACPYCARVTPTMQQLRQKYGNDLRIVYKQFIIHPQANAGALAFCAAARQGKAMEMDAMLWDKAYKQHTFDKLNCWTTAEGCPVVEGFAQQLGLDLNRVKAHVKSCVQIKDRDMAELRRIGVHATPSFFINGRFVEGARAIGSFTPVIDEELKKANERIQKGTPQKDYYRTWVVEKGLKAL